MKFSLPYALPLALIFCSMRLGAVHAQGPMTYDLDVVVYCDVGTHCGYASEAEHRLALENAIDTVNTIWRPTGVAFRPNIRFFYDNRLSDIRIDGTQDAVDSMRLRELYNDATRNPDVVTLFLTPRLDYCFSNVPPLPGDTYTDNAANRHGLFCLPFADGVTYAHELGHHFCLPHPHTELDPAEPDFVDHDGDLLSDTPPDPTHVEILDRPTLEKLVARSPHTTRAPRSSITA